MLKIFTNCCSSFLLVPDVAVLLDAYLPPCHFRSLFSNNLFIEYKEYLIAFSPLKIELSASFRHEVEVFRTNI